ncbi:hypothetical protein C8F04DRAFT_1211033 [Mycena alexandri]|uniref:Uncharacterized protein n=1 Tax=Mycena alexandri TaxID=1745969 RepID=A0AAD6X260_9AGAR|nr:hypothetical protein C8F04DRAFT_1211033 [Mycena alexandri]
MYMIWGLFPCAPYDPTVVITTRTLEFFRHAHARCPRLSIQAFVKSLCDVHGVPYRPYLCQQFTICYDVYLEVLRWSAEWVRGKLGRGERWRQENACPACTYKLEGEPDLIFSMLWTMDGNESLRRVIRKERTSGEVDENGEAVPGASKEREDGRDAGEGYFLDRDRVDEWAKAKVASMLPTDDIPGAETPCSDRWKNMVNDITSKMWGVFDETGIFPALCRHGFVLILVDMIRSGELAKYPLALIDELLDTYGKNQGGGYDIGCHFEATIRNSRLSERAQENALKMLVGAFHGHAHNRLCQLSFLATYIEGLGLEDLEGCERFFSKSNDLAKCVRYASRFHRQQDITQFIKHHDSFETYANLSKFLCNNYEQALDILRTESTLREWMRKEGIESGDVFKEWLKEEKEWLLQKKGSSGREVTLEMQYVQKLVNWSVCKTKLNTIRREIRQAKAADDNYDPATDLKRRRALQHASESLTQALGLVQDLEDRLDIDPNNRWTSTSVEWIAAVKQLREKKFSDALDALELLIVERIFELTKINRSQTGYKMRRHIAKALQTRSEAVKNAISRYNIAAASLEPPAPQLSWDEVVEYAFLADFDFLRATDGELLDKPWTRPAYRLAMDRYFKIIRAKEEIKRLNVEIRRFITWMSDEDRFLRRQEEEAESPGEAALIRKHRMERGRFDAGHMERLVKLSKKRGFTGLIMVCGGA